jgi:hypothetical protein
MSTKIFVLFAVSLVCLHAQSESALRQAFEGKTVRVKIDMPATNEGVDLHWRAQPPLDFRDYSQNVKRFGVALRNGDSVMVTTVRVKAKNIEFQLGGGGYGTFGDDSGNVSLGTVSKSRRENDLERDIRNETDRNRRDQMSRELSRLAADRQRENSYRRSQEQQLTLQRKRDIEMKRLQAGSRFNLRFPDNYLKESIPTPADLRQMLAEYVEFEGAEPSREPVSAPLSNQVRKGMFTDEVYRILGEPSDTARSPLGEHEQIVATWLQGGGSTKVFFINGVAVKIAVQTR